jgi:putative endonuclease
MRSTWTYILATKPRGTLYIGVTNGLIHRIEQHRAGMGSAFTRRYSVHTLVSAAIRIGKTCIRRCPVSRR